MKKSPSIQLKAFFLLVVFSLNTLLSFACAAGLDMGYNRDHHTSMVSSPAKHPGPGHKHPGSSHNANHHLKSIESNHDGAQHAQERHSAENSTPEDCCRDEAAKFEKKDKLNPQPVNYNLQPLFITLNPNWAYNPGAASVPLHNSDQRHLVRNHHPPIADTRIAIQSFLI
ncbi:hypothetical protein [Daejeonella sp. JGW-45]|uniref:hypothetical protein n=1 Tax=Daejeonella sp. JGW-45 TaxID=3034148 RepID=UPI0023EDDF1C|nr:hypothetical protein [Daejeonella sp. JGW-45]